jgi:hypothetical protein
LVGDRELFRKDAGFTYYGNKVRISRPAREHMHVQMMLLMICPGFAGKVFSITVQLPDGIGKVI